MKHAVRMTLLIVLIVGLVPAAVADDDPLQTTYDIFTLDFVVYNEGGGDWEELDIAEGTTTNLAPYASDTLPTTHEIVIMSRDGEELLSEDIFVDFEMHPYGGEHFEVDEREFSWRLPYDWDAKNITLYEFERTDSDDHGHGEVEVDHSVRDIAFTVDLEDELCQLDGRCRDFCDGKQIDADCSCGDGECHDHETPEICPEDCDPDFVGDAEDITDIGDDEDVTEEEGWFGIRTLVILSILIALLGSVILYAWKRVEIEDTERTV